MKFFKHFSNDRINKDIEFPTFNSDFHANK